MSDFEDDPRVQAARDRYLRAREHADRLLAISNDLGTDEGWAAYIADLDAGAADEQYSLVWDEVQAELHPGLYAGQSDPEAEP